LSYRKFVQYKAAQEEIVWFEVPAIFRFMKTHRKFAGELARTLLPLAQPNGTSPE